MLVAYVGQATLYMTFAAVVAAAILLICSYREQREGLIKAGTVALQAGVLGATIAVALLLYALLSDKFELAYVARNSRSLMQWPYKIGALWSGQAGSLLLWFWVLLIYSYAIGWRHRWSVGREKALTRSALAVMAIIAGFFAILVTFIENPFALRLPAPEDGQGMNPLLQNPSMLIHPLLVYGGFVGFSVPFAYAIASLWLRMTDATWLRMSRSWALVAWLLLSMGILVGAEWAYIELGWGGYWGWDPVENASLLPWLTATAFLHSSMVQQRRGMLKVWNLGLMLGTYTLTILGTLITRSGILDSVHAFAQSPIGPWFVAYLGLTITGSIYLLIDRYELLREQPRFESYWSREVAFHGNNLILLAVTAAVLWGTLFPIISRLTGSEVTVGPPYYNRVAGPLLLGLLILMGIAPILAWRKSSPESVGRRLWVPAFAALICLQVLVLAGIRQPVALIGFPLIVFVAVLVIGEIMGPIFVKWRTGHVSLLKATWDLFMSSRPRYGGYVVHLGIVLIALGVLASSNFTTEVRTPLRLGETIAVAGYEFQYMGLERTVENGVPAVHANLVVFRDGRPVAVMQPEKRYFAGFVETMGPTTEIAVWGSLAHDVYVVLAGFDDSGVVAGFEISIKPLMAWIWIGGYLLMGGTLFSLWPARRNRSVSLLTSPWLDRIHELDNDLAVGKLDRQTYERQRRELVATLREQAAYEAQLVAELDRLVQQRLQGNDWAQTAGAGGRR